MDKIYDCLDSQKLYEIFKALGSARNAIYFENGISVVSSTQYQDLIHVLHDVELALADLLLNDSQKLENHYVINKV